MLTRLAALSVLAVPAAWAADAEPLRDVAQALPEGQHGAAKLREALGEQRPG